MSKVNISLLDKPISIRISGEKVQLPATLQVLVDDNWRRLLEDKPQLHNGEVFTVSEVIETEDLIEILLTETRYAHYLYDREFGGLDQYSVHIIHSATFVMTADGKLVVGEMAPHTSLSGIIQCSGGGIDFGDITDRIVDIEHSTAKELSEELGIDAYDKNRVESFEPKYFKTGGDRGVMVILYVLRLKEDAREFDKAYEEYIDKIDEDPEFSRLFYVDLEKKSVKTFLSRYGHLCNEYLEAFLTERY